ncbi:MAG TPA: 50S ribosomal protein L24 [Candidatus Pacearchaeota archaeon]|jgi:large subunit ribosomal protein L24|nr:50S ribosomal protein L24 [Candidatus Pacearchaeota archaeon]|tara:strand:+ start:201 stop:635 length:435 start_codon:yes stop_codon:yes gene_type:complete
MKQKFSASWTGSKQPRKQRKYRANAPLHLRRKMISISLSKELKKKHDKRNFPVRKGDNVSIMRGEFKGKSGKIESVDMKKMKVIIDGIYRTKKDGSKVAVMFEPSNLQIKELVLEDKKRKESLERKASVKNIKTENKKETKKNA